MGNIELLLIAIGLSMDAFAVSITKGLSINTIKRSHYLKVGLWFGLFQAIMPILGYFFCLGFSVYITSIDHWIAFFLLSIIGLNMIRESFSKGEEDKHSSDFSAKTMFLMAVATSIDALAMGVSFALMKVDITLAAVLIGIITCICSMFGLKLGQLCGTKLKNKAEFTGGIILVLIGLKILVEHICL